LLAETALPIKKEYKMYIVSHESASVEFPKWVRTKTGVDAQGSIVINGGAGVINKKTMETPKGVITEITAEDLKFLKTQTLFNEKVEAGSYEIVETEKKAKESSKRGKKDKGAQLTAKDFEESGQTPPMVGAEEKPDDGSHLEDAE
jgi:rRNA maturation endonuclease Nob1